MHWQFGGNFRPVLRACEYRWKECSYALAHYIWFEVVTDVADSLANELILWRILAVLLIFMTIVHFLYWKKQWIREIDVTNESLKKIDFKVQDLELKINILTYKAQYDTWPLMQLLKVDNGNDLEPNFSKQNAYLKYFLARTRRKNIENKALMYIQPQSLLSELNVCDLKSKYISSKFEDKLLQQTSYIEKKLSVTSLQQTKTKTANDENLIKNQSGNKNNSLNINLSEEPTTEENFKLYRSSSDSSLNDHLRSIYLGSKKITKINVKPGKILHRKRISPEISEKQLKFSLSSTNNSSASKNILLLNQNKNFPYQGNNSNEETHETLNQVKEKLQCLHSTLRNYSDDLENTLNSHSSNKIWDDRFKKANTIQAKNGYDKIKNQRGDYNYDECISLKKSINSYDTSKTVNFNDIKESKISKISSQANDSDERSCTHTEGVRYLLKSNTTLDGCCIEKDETRKKLNHSKVETKQTITESDADQQFSLVESFKESDSDDRSISALIQEALKFKQELMLQIESSKAKDEINIQSNNNENKPYDYSNWQSDTDFEPNSLDKITEESSGNSVADKKSKTRILITKENCENIVKENYKGCKNENTSIENVSLKTDLTYNQASVEIIAVEKIDLVDQPSSLNSNKMINSEDSLLIDSVKKIQDGPETTLQNSEEIYDSKSNNNLKVDSDVKPLSDTSSDTSVNRLLDRLIESERKCKSAKSLTNSKIKEDADDSLNTFIIPHTFFDNAPFETNKNSLPVEAGAEKQFAEKLDSGIGSYENKNFDSGSLNTDEIEESEIIQTVIDDRKEKNKKIAQNNLPKKNMTQTNPMEIEGNEILFECFDRDKHLKVNDDSIDNSTNVVKSMCKLQSDEMKNEDLIVKKDAGDFFSDSEIIQQKTTHNSKKNLSPSGDSGSFESNIVSKSTVKLRNPMYHSSCKGQTGFKNSEQSSIKVQQKSSSNSIQRQSVKANFELGNDKQFKAKSNLNLSSAEHVNPLPTHRRSKSYVASCDIPLINQNKATKSENIPVQLVTELENHNKINEENLCTTSEISKKSFSKPCTPQSSKKFSNDEKIQFFTKENNFTSLPSRSSSKSSIPILLKDTNVENAHNKSDVKRKLSSESVSSKSSSKSCIPILKTRLELVTKDDDFHPKSSSTGSLKVNVECFGTEEIVNSLTEENVKKQENHNFTELMEQNDIIFTNSSAAFELEYCTDSHDYVRTYINTMIEDIQFGVDTNNEKKIFDECKSELVEQNTSSDQTNPAFIEDTTSSMPEQDASLDLLIKRDDDLTNVISLKTCSLEVQSDSSRISSSKDSKETEVLAKPCTLDTSTSMTNVPSLANASDSKANELKILEVPEQLTKDEYITLLQLINEHPDFEHLLNLGLQK